MPESYLPQRQVLHWNELYGLINNSQYAIPLETVADHAVLLKNTDWLIGYNPYTTKTTRLTSVDFFGSNTVYVKAVAAVLINTAGEKGPAKIVAYDGQGRVVSVAKPLVPRDYSFMYYLFEKNTEMYAFSFLNENNEAIGIFPNFIFYGSASSNKRIDPLANNLGKNPFLIAAETAVHASTLEFTFTAPVDLRGINLRVRAKKPINNTLLLFRIYSDDVCLYEKRLLIPRTNDKNEINVPLILGVNYVKANAPVRIIISAENSQNIFDLVDGLITSDNMPNCTLRYNQHYWPKMFLRMWYIER
jgi:hypothetical protein